VGALDLNRAGVGEGVGGGGDVIERERLAGVDGDVGGVERGRAIDLAVAGDIDEVAAAAAVMVPR